MRERKDKWSWRRHDNSALNGARTATTVAGGCHAPRASPRAASSGTRDAVPGGTPPAPPAARRGREERRERPSGRHAAAQRHPQADTVGRLRRPPRAGAALAPDGAASQRTMCRSMSSACPMPSSASSDGMMVDCSARRRVGWVSRRSRNRRPATQGVQRKRRATRRTTHLRARLPPHERGGVAVNAVEHDPVREVGIRLPSEDPRAHEPARAPPVGGRFHISTRSSHKFPYGEHNRPSQGETRCHDELSSRLTDSLLVLRWL